MKHSILRKIFLFFLFVPLLLRAQSEGHVYTTPERLFHIARSVNRNLVCYDVQLIQGKVSAEHPIKVYWLNREERPGARDGLSYIQRKWAYGYQAVRSASQQWTCTLKAYPKRSLTLTCHQGKWCCLVRIRQQEAILKSIYVKSRDHNPLKVEYVELKGCTLAGGRDVSERIYK